MLLDISISKKDPPPLKRGEVRIVRRFDDGLVEIEDHRGRRQRVQEQGCRGCSRPILRPQGPTFLSPAPVCQPCADAEYRRRQESIERSAKKRRMLQLEMGQTSPQRRQTLLLLAMPKWRDRKAINAVYNEAKRKSRETGIKHHVDHIYPIQGAVGCGLHVHWNLQVMVGAENCSKGADFPLDQSPAWDGCSIEEINWEVRKMVREFEQTIDKGAKISPLSAQSK